MKKTVLLFIHTFTCMAIHPRLESIKIYQDSPSFNSIGYNNCNSDTNGEYNLIQHVLQPNDIVFDVGANVGNWSKQVLNVNPHAHIHAFEPIPTSFKILQQNLTKQNVFLHNIAIAKDVRFEDFIIYLINSDNTECSSLYYRPVIAHYIAEKIQVRTSDLDSFCNEHLITHIDFLKIDTEGAEWAVLLGAQELLNRKAITLIQFEYGGTNIDAKTTLHQIYDMFISKGYLLFRIIPDGLIQINNWRPELETYEYSNYLAAAIIN